MLAKLSSMINIRSVAAVLIFSPTLSSLGNLADQPSDLPKKAIERSQLTQPGSRPFVLKAKVVESTNLANVDYRAEIEETWSSPDKWRRTVKTNKFSQILVVNGTKTTEQLTGDYYPNWLRTIVSALFDPGLEAQGVDLSRSSDNPMIGGNKLCRRFTYMAGVAPVTNKVFSTFCFEGGLLDSISTGGYNAYYENYKNFAGKKVGHKIREYIESGTELEATIEELSEAKSIDESLFTVSETSVPLQTIRTNERTLRDLIVGSPEITWPTVRSGADKGTLSLYLCIDRAGRVREIYKLNSSNPGVSDAVRDQVIKWQFKPAVNRGQPVQVEGILTFAFQTAVANPIPVLEEPEGQKLILRRVEPAWPSGLVPSGAPLIVTIGVRESGECYGVVFITSDDANRAVVMKPASLSRIAAVLEPALKQWRFQPYMQNGKATEYQVKVTFHVN